MKDEAFRLLIADDEYWVRQAIETLINWEAHGFERLPSAQDGEDAWEKIETGHPDIVLLDINMPFLSGIELTRRVHEQYPDIAVLILSGYSDFEYVREAMKNGAIDYLLKPADRDKMLAALSLATEHLLRRQEERKRLDALREKSELAASLLLDQELSELLETPPNQKDAVNAKVLSYELQFTGYYLAQIRMLGIRPGMEEIHRLKGAILQAFDARQKLAFHKEGTRGTFFVIVEMEQDALMAACQRLMRALERQAPGGVSIFVSNRKNSFRQLRAAWGELRQMQLVRPYLAESCVLSAGEFQETPVQNRIDAPQRKELETAIKNHSRALFRQLVYEQIGLKDCVENGWLHVELLHALSALGHLLRGSLPRETTVSRAAAMDNLMELMLVAADHFDLREAFSLLEEMCDEAFGVLVESAAGEGMRQTIQQVKEYIEENYADNLSLHFLAHRFLVDDAYLSRTFKQTTGENLMLYIAKVRMEKAREYIAKGGWSLGEIASMTGYDDYAYFNRVFRKIAGKSPSAYREECE